MSLMAVVYLWSGLFTSLLCAQYIERIAEVCFIGRTEQKKKIARLAHISAQRDTGWVWGKTEPMARTRGRGFEPNPAGDPVGA